MNGLASGKRAKSPASAAMEKAVTVEMPQMREGAGTTGARPGAFALSAGLGPVSLPATFAP
jgi:hypothetical protein